jgi:hypothetical protein
MLTLWHDESPHKKPRMVFPQGFAVTHIGTNTSPKGITPMKGGLVRERGLSLLAAGFPVPGRRGRSVTGYPVLDNNHRIKLH